MTGEPVRRVGVVGAMTKNLPDARQRSEILIEAGKNVRLRVAADLSPAGLLAIGALVSGILLSTTVLVTAAGKAAARQPRRPE